MTQSLSEGSVRNAKYGALRASCIEGVRVQMNAGVAVAMKQHSACALTHPSRSVHQEGQIGLLVDVKSLSDHHAVHHYSVARRLLRYEFMVQHLAHNAGHLLRALQKKDALR